MNVSDHQIKEILQNFKKIAVVGMSPKSERPSQAVPRFMRDKGFDLVGVNPGQTSIAGFTVYENLSLVPPEYREFVDVFRSPEHIPQLVDEVLALGGVKVLWLQLGIEHKESERRAEAAGIQVVSNRCLVIEYKKFFGTT